MSDLNSSLPVTDTTDGTTGSTAPTTAQEVGGKDGSGNLQSIKVDASGRVLVDLHDGSGSSISSTSNSLNVNITNGISVTPTNGTTATYSASSISTALGVLATDFFTITGSATKTIKVQTICVSFRGSGTLVSVQLLRRSTANTGGTSSTLTDTPHDSNNSAATAIVRSYTANPTLGTLVGTLRASQTDSPLASSTTNPEGVLYSFKAAPSQPIVLRGTSEVLAFNLNGVTLTSSSATTYVEWTEE